MNLVLFSHQAESYSLPRSDRRHRHIRSILRARVGDVLRAGVINGPVGEILIEQLDDNEIVLAARWQGPAPPPAPVTVLLGHPRPPVLKRLWRDMASLGVEEIRVFSGDLGERSYLTSSAWDDPDLYLQDGLSQGGHTVAPRLLRFARLDEALEEDPDTPEEGRTLRLFGALRSDDGFSLEEMLREVNRSTSVRICVGPERGFADREETLLRGRGYRPVSLGQRILRTETAATLLVGSVCSQEF